MKTYELTYIISPEMTSEEAEAKAKSFEAVITSKEGTVVKQLNPVAKTLSYPIKKRASGFFSVLEFQLEPEKLIELKEIIEKDEKVVRHMITIKLALESKKARRTRVKPESAITFGIEKKAEVETIKEEKVEPTASEDTATKDEDKKATPKKKVELKDIEKSIDELLG